MRDSLLPKSGTIYIPDFNAGAVGDDGDDVGFPYCCGISVIGEWSNTALDVAEYQYVFDEDDEYDNRKTLQTYDYANHRYVVKKNPDYNPSPQAKTKNLTRAAAIEWWSQFALNIAGTSVLMATTVDSQAEARNNLVAGGWKVVETFRSKGTGSTITLLRFTVPNYVRPDPTKPVTAK